MRQTLLLGLIAATVSLPAFASHDDRDDNYEDRARVISVTPQLERVNTPRQECRTEYVRESVYENRGRSPGGAIIGGVAGGLLGSTIGRGNGRVVAAVLGAGVGAVVGDRIDNNDYRNGRQRVESRPVERCVTVDNWSQVPVGYLVNYEYNGRQYTTVTNQDPGRYVPVNVSVRPNGYVTNVAYSSNDDRYEDDDREYRGRGRENGRGNNKHRNRHYW
jgi:uncharacterized protein YcfJ